MQEAEVAEELQAVAGVMACWLDVQKHFHLTTKQIAEPLLHVACWRGRVSAVALPPLVSGKTAQSRKIAQDIM